MEKTTCLVIGGSGALGAEICRTLYQENCQIVFTYYQNNTRAQELCSELPETKSLFLDLQDLDNIHKTIHDAVAELGKLDALIFASGTPGENIYYRSSITSMEQPVSSKKFDEIMNINSKGIFFACLAAYPFFKEQNKGNIIVLGSIDCVKNVPSPVHFAMSKTALKGMVGAMAKELGNYNVCVNIIAPGILDGGASAEIAQDRIEEYKKHCSLNRLGKMSEIANTVCWFVKENTYLTGQSILLDGGL